MTFLFGVPVGVVEHGTLRKVEREESFKRNALAGVESENVEVGEGLFPGINCGECKLYNMNRNRDDAFLPCHVQVRAIEVGTSTAEIGQRCDRPIGRLS
jgi:hypothetical protein